MFKWGGLVNIKWDCPFGCFNHALTHGETCKFGIIIFCVDGKGGKWGCEGWTIKILKTCSYSMMGVGEKKN
jgi:hypothetical protein